MGIDKKNQKIDKFRGEFIGKMLMIEIVLSKLIAAYIAPEKMNYIEFMLSKMDMPKKIEIYEQILKKDKDSTFVEHTYKGLTKDIDDMQKIRNLFAHSMAEISFFGFKKTKPVYSNKITFRNSKNMNRDFFTKVAESDYDIKGHKEKLEKLDKIYDCIFNVWYYYNRRLPSTN